jgi:hypothetical protein
MEIYSMEQYSDAWFEVRLGRVTGTHFQTLVSKPSSIGYKGLVNRIAAELITERADPLEKNYTNDIMENGLETEEEAALVFCEEVAGGLPILEEVGFITPDRDHKYKDWIGVSPDRMIINEARDITGGLEIKCPLAKTQISYIVGGVLPNDYKHQIQGAMYVTGFDKWLFMSYYPNMKPFIIEVKRDPEFMDLYENALKEFTAEVKNKIETYKKYSYEI